jgi:DNA-binding IclR family transcriptional regulator
MTKPATTVTKICRILGVFRDRPSLGITEIAHRTGLLPSDVHRLLGSLQMYGYIQQDDGTKRYTIGSELLDLSARNLQIRSQRSVLSSLPAAQEIST